MRYSSRLLITIVLLAMVPALPGSSAVPIPLANPSFEASTAGWTLFGDPRGCSFQVSDLWHSDGESALSIADARTDDSCGAYQAIAVQADERYQVRATFNVGSGTPQLYLRWVNALGRDVGTFPYDTANSLGVWHLSASGVAPAGATHARLWAYSTASNSGTFFVDDVRAIHCEEACQVSPDCSALGDVPASREDAQPIDLPLAMCAGVIASETDVDAYSFTLSEPALGVFALTGSNSLQLLLDGEAITGSQSSGGMNVVSLTDGRHDVQVASAGAWGPYELSIGTGRCPPDEAVLATPIHCAGQIERSPWEPYNVEDVFRIDVAPGQSVHLQVAHDHCWMHIQLLDPSGASVEDWEQPGPVHVTHPTIQGGEYTLRVTSVKCSEDHFYALAVDTRFT